MSVENDLNPVNTDSSAHSKYAKLSAEDNDKIVSVKNDLNQASTDSSTYSVLKSEIGSGGNIKLQHDYYTYDSGSRISISTNDSVIDGNGATIDMAGSNIQAFYVSASGVIIKNLAIINANYDGDGVAIYFSSLGTVENCNFTNNSATYNGGAIHMYSGNIENCNFINNSATYYGGAIEINGEGNLTNCNFTNNTASRDSGAVWMRSGNVENCNFTKNSATYNGGAIRFSQSGNLTNCNFTDNSASEDGGAIYMHYGNVENCNFTDNSASEDGGAIYMYSGNVENCNFTDNSASEDGGAVYSLDNGNVTNCNFTDNSASEDGGAIYMYYGNVENCNFTDNSATYDGGAIRFSQSGNVTNCNFTNNSASRGGAVLSEQYLGVTVDTCIVKTNSDTTFNTHNIPPALTVDDFTTVYGSHENLTFDLKTSSGVPIYDGNILIRVYFKNDDSWVGDYSCLSGEGWAVDLPVGSYYALYNTVLYKCHFSYKQ